MNLVDFDEYVSDKIYERGEDYFDWGAVKQLSRSGNKWTAKVAGTEMYKVDVSLDEGQNIVSSKCNCPYDYGNTCKHEVAVYMAINDVVNGDSDIDEYEEVEEAPKSYIKLSDLL